MGGSLSSLRDVVRQMHTIQRKAVIYITLRVVGYLLLWKYSCSISGTQNSTGIIDYLTYQDVLDGARDLNEILSLFDSDP